LSYSQPHSSDLQIFKGLKDWSAPIEGLRRAFAANLPGKKKSKGKAKADLSSLGRDIVLPKNVTQEAITVRNDILTLWRAFRHASSANLHNILSNTELLTSAVSWFSQVCRMASLWIMNTYICSQRHKDFPESARQLGEALWR
jgi:hypothetical protein